MGKANLVYGKPVMGRHTETGTHVAGDVIVIGATPCVAHVDIPSFTGGTLTDALAVGGGIYQMTVNGALALGQDVWWDSAAGKISGVAAGNVHFGILLAGPTLDMSGAAPAADGDQCLVFHMPEGFTPYTLPGIKAEATVSVTATLTGAQVLNGFINSAPAGAINLTLPTAALMVAAMKGAKVGDSFECVIENTSGGANAITILAGGATLRGGAVIAQNKAAILKGVLTNVTAAAEAYTVYSVVGA